MFCNLPTACTAVSAVWGLSCPVLTSQPLTRLSGAPFHWSCQLASDCVCEVRGSQLTCLLCLLSFIYRMSDQDKVQTSHSSGDPIGSIPPAESLPKCAPCLKYGCRGSGGAPPCTESCVCKTPTGECTRLMFIYVLICFCFLSRSACSPDHSWSSRSLCSEGALRPRSVDSGLLPQLNF